MRTLPRPVDSAGDTYRLCISSVRDADLKRRLDSAEPQIIAASKQFDSRAKSATLHLIAQHSSVGGVVSTKEMSAVYGRMAGKNTPGRPVYDRLVLSAVHGRCPLCAQRTVSTLDHHLPKAKYPSLAVTPLNLIPACADCNKVKLENTPADASNQTLHPYFDDVEGDEWLNAEVVHGSPVAIRFFVDAPAHWHPVKASRVRFHFKTFKLSILFGSHAAEELQNLRYGLALLLASTDADAVQQHLVERAGSCRAAWRNSWQTAMYAAVAADRWFCEGGFGS